MRQSNAADFWRGFALVHILVGHIPDNGFWRITLKQFSWSDGAEILVLLAGWALALRIAARPQDATSFVVPRLIAIYAAHVIVTLALVLLYADSYMRLGDATILRDKQLDVADLADGSAIVGVLVMLTHVSYFDILPLYFVLTLFIPAIVVLGRVSLVALALFSLLLYVVAQSGVSPQQWPSGAPWAFNPLAWQFLFVCGFIAASVRGEIASFIDRTPLVFAGALAITAASLVLIRLGVPAPLADRAPLEAFLWDKSDAGVLRLMQFAALCVLAYRFSPAIANLFPLVWRLGALLGRNSLLVFSVSGVLAAVGEIAHRQGHHGVFFDSWFTAGSIGLMLGCAWLHERQQQKRKRLKAACAAGSVAG